MQLVKQTNDSAGTSAVPETVDSEGVSGDCVSSASPRRARWSKELCAADARRFTRRVEWSKHSSGYQAAAKQGWIDECCIHMAPPKVRRFTLEICMERAKRHQNISDWRRKNVWSYEAARAQGWSAMCVQSAGWTSGTDRGHSWTLNDCQRDAQRYSTRAQWGRWSPASFRAAEQHEWIDACSRHMTGEVKWTFATCMNDAARFSVPYEWRTASGSAYTTASRHGWLTRCTAHMVRKRKNRSLADCMTDALQFDTFFTWRKTSPRAYRAALKNGWLELCSSLFAPGAGPLPRGHRAKFKSRTGSPSSSIQR